MKQVTSSWSVFIQLQNSRFSVKDIRRIIAYLIIQTGRTRSNFISELFNDGIEASVIVNVAHFMKEDC